MPLTVWLASASAAAYLALALTALSRRARHPLARHLALLCVGLFAYNLQEAVSVLTGQRAWTAVGDAAAALTAVATFELFLGFLGASRRLALPIRVARAYFGAVGLVGLSPLVWPSLAPLHDSGAWSVLMLIGLMPGFGILLRLIVRHARRREGPERTRAQILGAALLLGVGSAMTDLAGTVGLDVPRVSYVGLLLSALLIAGLTFEARIVEGARAGTVANAVALALLAVAAQLVLLSSVSERAAVLAFGALVAALATAAALVPLVTAWSERRSRMEHHATLGRFAQQMAHDLRNPLAAIKGAAQVLQSPVGGGAEQAAEMLAIIVERVDRIERLVADYQRLGRVELSLREVGVNAIVEDALAAVGEIGGGSVELSRDLAPAPPPVFADPDLLGFAIENLLRNGCEAMPTGGVLRVATEVAEEGRAVRVVVRDAGAGMDVRTRERALDGLFTTKAGGTGLGLSFVRRVVEAHRGRLRLESEVGRGTTATIELPAGPRAVATSAGDQGASHDRPLVVTTPPRTP